jgi:hypothetical protein
MPALALSADTEFMDASERLSAGRGSFPGWRTPQTWFAKPQAATGVVSGVASAAGQAPRACEGPTLLPFTDEGLKATKHPAQL